MPPLMIVHGADDQTISPKGAEALAAAAIEGGVRHELQVLPDQGHAWTGERAELAADYFAYFVVRELGELQAGQRD